MRYECYNKIAAGCCLQACVPSRFCKRLACRAACLSCPCCLLTAEQGIQLHFGSIVRPVLIGPLIKYFLGLGRTRNMQIVEDTTEKTAKKAEKWV